MNALDPQAATRVAPPIGAGVESFSGGERRPRAPWLAARLARWSDPEWPLFAGILLAPAVLFWAFGHGQQASFFTGVAVCVSVLKWLGWLLFTRAARPRLGYLYFPAEIFVGLAAATGWFYLRNVFNAIWPGSYSLRELSWLFALVLGLHLACGLLWGFFRRRAGQPFPSVRTTPGQTGTAAAANWMTDRLAFYGPFCLALVLALWSVSGTLSVEGTDALHHTFSTRVYLTGGLAFHVPPTGFILDYPSGFGALTTIACAVAPLTEVQSFHLVHVLLCITCPFLVTGTIANLAGRPLWPLHSLVLPFLTVFPLYALFPDIFYSGTPKQVGPPLFAALCLLPLLTDATRKGSVFGCLAAVAVLGQLAVAMNPACALFAAAASFVALVILLGRRAAGVGVPHILATQFVLTLLAALLVLGSDPFYRRSVAGHERQAERATPLAQAGAEETAGPGVFSSSEASRYLAWVNPLRLSPVVSMTFLTPQIHQRRHWTEDFPQQALPPLAFALGLLTLGPTLITRRNGAPVSPLTKVALGSLLLYLLVKYVVSYLAGGVLMKSSYLLLLSVYSRYLLLRCELLLLFTSALASGVYLAFVLSAWRQAGRLRSAIVVLVIGLSCWVLPLACFASDTHLSGYVRMPLNKRYPITAEDIRFVAWVEDHIPPEKGLIGLAAERYECGRNNEERHLYPMASGVAAILYGKHYNYRFLLPALEGDVGFYDYGARVHQRLDVEWCLQNNVRYFLVPEAGLRENPGLEQAIKDGVLRPIGQGGSLTLYAVGHDD